MKNILFISVLLSLMPLASSANSPEIVNQFLVTEEYEQALTAVTEGLGDQPESRVMLLQKGFLLIKMRKLKEAETHYQQVIEIIPDDPEPMNNLGVVFQLQREYGKAIAQLNDTIQKFPGFVQAYENLGDTYIQIATAQYIAGRDKAPNNTSLNSKADLGQRFYLAAKENAATALITKGDGESSNQEKIGASESSTVSEENTVDIEKAVESELAEFLRSWVAGWSSKDTLAYLAHYSDNFTPSQGRPLETWKQRKQEIIDKAEFIKIRVEGIKLEQLQGSQADLSFDLNYESDTYQSDSRKTLQLTKENGNWLIISEQ